LSAVYFSIENIPIFNRGYTAHIFHLVYRQTKAARRSSAESAARARH
jgi:hypothetical protein